MLGQSYFENSQLNSPQFEDQFIAQSRKLSGQVQKPDDQSEPKEQSFISGQQKNSSLSIIPQSQLSYVSKSKNELRQHSDLNPLQNKFSSIISQYKTQKPKINLLRTLKKRDLIELFTKNLKSSRKFTIPQLLNEDFLQDLNNPHKSSDYEPTNNYKYFLVFSLFFAPLNFSFFNQFLLIMSIIFLLCFLTFSVFSHKQDLKSFLFFHIIPITLFTLVTFIPQKIIQYISYISYLTLVSTIVLNQPISLMYLVIYLTLYLHLISLCWIEIGLQSDDSWIKQIQSNIYIVAFHLATCSCLPFGNTQIHPETELEMIFQSFTSIISFCIILFFLKYLLKSEKSNLLQFNSLLDEWKIEKKKKFLEIFQKAIQNRQKYRIMKMVKLINQINPKLQKEILIKMKIKQIKNCGFFGRIFGQKVLEQLALHSQQINLQPNKVIFQKNSQIDPAFFLIVKGSVALFEQPCFCQKDNQKRQIGILNSGELLGSEYLFIDDKYGLTVETQEYTTLLKISRELIEAIIEDHKEDKVSGLVDIYEGKISQLEELNLELLKFRIDWSLMLQLQESLPFDSLMSIASLYSKQTIPTSQILLFSSDGSSTLYSIHVEIQRLLKQQCIYIYQFDYQKINIIVKEFHQQQGITTVELQDEDYDEDELDYDQSQEKSQLQEYDFGQKQSSEKLTSNDQIKQFSINDKQKSNEIISGNTYKDLFYADQREQYLLNSQEDEIQMGLSNEQIQIARNSQSKVSYSTGGFQKYEDSQSNNTLQNCLLVQIQGQPPYCNPPQLKSNPSNTYKSSNSISQNTYQSQSQNQKKSSPSDISQRQQKRINQQPKLTFQQQPQQQAVQKISQQEMFQYLIKNRSSNLNLQQSGLAVVSEENQPSQSQLNLPVNSNQQLALNSGMSISSVGMPSIDDNIKAGSGQGQGTRTNSNKQRLTSSYDKSKTLSGIQFGDQGFQYMSDIDVVKNVRFSHQNIRDTDLDLDRIKNYHHFMPEYNIQNILEKLEMYQYEIS